MQQVESQMALHDTKMMDLEDRSRRNNLRLRGLPKSIQVGDLQAYATGLFQSLCPDIPAKVFLLDWRRGIPARKSLESISTDHSMTRTLNLFTNGKTRTEYVPVYLPIRFGFPDTIPPKKEEMIALKPEDIIVKISPGLVNISWTCTIKKNMVYRIDICENHLIDEEFNLRKCFHEIKADFELHKGVSINITPGKHGEQFKWNVTKFFPSGDMNMSAENISCTVYNVFYMDCSWDVGREAPNDVIYNFSLIQKSKTLPCPRYGTDSRGRAIKCFLEVSNIDTTSTVYIAVTGTSNETEIMFTDASFKPVDKEILNPPKNLTVTKTLEGLVCTWEKPSDTFQKHCFQYELQINQESHTIEKKNTFTIPTHSPDEVLTIKIRATYVELCGKNGWGEWTEPLTYGKYVDLFSSSWDDLGKQHVQFFLFLAIHSVFHYICNGLLMGVSNLCLRALPEFQLPTTVH
ncbi:granulocyte-macrophage colony-stimulating factor receptor subunit alpha-like isoform X1 [Pelobates cultripes]|uniref:Granulocyte-macrophage colony-stimulating factor receptor subunit alpha-like isoform X1 n=1 Tax=Pelobates cultripes TaxID=61616 RepID=A0AAD1R0B6_PELCU|nr:granulocyte-macrophage colony-stimulating factor receptor subunit alpha-like isoform X1 [Pelobates cultripes]